MPDLNQSSTRECDDMPTGCEEWDALGRDLAAAVATQSQRQYDVADQKPATADEVECVPVSNAVAGNRGVEAVLTLSVFLEAFFPNPSEAINLRFLCPREGNPKDAVQGDDDYQAWPRSRTVRREILATDTRVQETLKGWNKQRGAYFVPNAAGEILSGDPVPGGYVDQAITGGIYEDKKKGAKTTYAPGRFTACFAEIDDRPISEQHALLDVCPLQPSIRVETRKSVHAYWLLDNSPGDKCEANWREAQKRLIEVFGSDDKIKNPARLMRLPFFNHLKLDPATKKNTATKVRCVVFEPDRRYSLNELLAAFPPAPEEKQEAKTGSKSKKSSAGGFTTWDALRAELGRRIEAHESASKNASGKIDCRGICHDGTGDTGLFYDPATNQARCNDGCEQEAILRAFGLPEKPDPPAKKKAKTNNQPVVDPEQEEADEGSGDRRQSKASMAVELAADAELFHNAEGKTFARVRVNGHFETWLLKSSSFKKWLGARFWQEHKSTIHPPAIAEALLTLDGRASYEGEQREVFIRIAEHDDAIYLDLCDDKWGAIEIKATGSRVIEAADCPVRFRRTNGMLALPEPAGEGNIGDLRAILNLSEDNQPQWVLVMSWLIAAFRPGAPYPILAVHGEQGSAKSTTCRMLRALIDPNTAALRSAPKEERDLMIAASNSHVVAFDNLTHISDSMSDALCRLSTGGGFATRELYSNDDEVIFDLKRPIMLNGITEIATKSDLLDRSILVYLPQIEPDKRLEEKEVWAKFFSARPRVLGALLNAVGVALRELPNTKFDRLPRMADFAKWATAAETGLSLNVGAFIAAYKGNRSEANDLALEASVLATELRDAFKDQPYWEGSSTDLLKLLNTRIEARNENPKTKTGWPQSPKGLTDKLKVLAPNLRAAGLDVVPGRVRGRSLVKIGKPSASSAISAKDQRSQQLDSSESSASGSERGESFVNGGANDVHDVPADNGICNDAIHSQQKTFVDDADEANDIPTFTTGDKVGATASAVTPRPMEEVLREMDDPTHRRRVTL